MKRFLIILIISLFSYSAFADKIQGHFFCEKKFPDGSGSKFTIKVDNKKMIIKELRKGEKTEYKEIYFADSYLKEFTIFVQPNSNIVLFLAPIDKNRKIKVTTFSANIFDEKNMIAHGLCDRI